MRITELSLQEQQRAGARFVAEIDYTDLTDTAGTSKTLTLISGGLARDIVNRRPAWVDLIEAFDGGATDGLTFDLGYNGATTDDADAFLDAVELHADATERLADIGSVPGDTVDETYGTQEAGVINALRARRPFAAQEAYAIELVVTSSSANLSALTAGRARVYFDLLRPSELRNINGE